MTLARKVQMASVGGNGYSGPPIAIGNATAGYSRGEDWVAGNAPDVRAIALPGDLVVIALSFDENSDDAWSWAGMPFVAVNDDTGSTIPGSYVGYHVVRKGDQNPYPTGTDGSFWTSVSVVAAVFRGVNELITSAVATGESAVPNPPALNGVVGSQLRVVTGHLDDDAGVFTAPSGFILNGSEFYDGGNRSSTSTGLAFKITTEVDLDPATFVIPASDSWTAVHMAFN